MMSECDLTETETGEPVLDTGERAVPVLESNFHSIDPPKVFFDRNRIGLTTGANPGGAIRISDSCESVLTELETEGSGEEALLLPCLAGSSSSPRGVKEKRSRRYRHSSSSDKDALASPGKCFKSRPLKWLYMKLINRQPHSDTHRGYVFSDILLFDAYGSGKILPTQADYGCDNR